MHLIQVYLQIICSEFILNIFLGNKNFGNKNFGNKGRFKQWGKRPKGRNNDNEKDGKYLLLLLVNLCFNILLLIYFFLFINFAFEIYLLKSTKHYLLILLKNIL